MIESIVIPKQTYERCERSVAAVDHLRALVKVDCTDDTDSCHFCGSEYPFLNRPHAPTCPYAAAKAFLEKLDAPHEATSEG